jgi:hypothetical protein
MAQAHIPWLRLGLLRFALGLFGVAAGLALGAIYVIGWHCVGLAILFLSGLGHYDWAYAWDLIFLAALLYGGHRYKARMPPESPFAKGETPLASDAVEVVFYRGEQAAFGISEVLFVAPRFFFWGIRHLRRITWPSAEIAQTAERIYAALRPAKQGIPYDDVLGMGGTHQEALRALALLAKAELVLPLHHSGILFVQAAEPDWI